MKKPTVAAKNAEKKPRKAAEPKAEKKKAKGAKAAKPAPEAKGSVKGDNLPLDPVAKETFLRCLGDYKKALEVKKRGDAKFKNVCKSVKDSGVKLHQIKAAIQMETPEGEEEVRLEIADTLLIARYMSADIGSQLELFMEPSRVPAVDRAFSEGETASMSNLPRSPSYAPSTPQYAAWMDGYNKHQETLAKGIKQKPEPMFGETDLANQQPGGTA